MILKESEDYQIDERINPNGTIDDISNQRETEEKTAKGIYDYIINCAISQSDRLIIRNRNEAKVEHTYVLSEDSRSNYEDKGIMLAIADCANRRQSKKQFEDDFISNYVASVHDDSNWNGEFREFRMPYPLNNLTVLTRVLPHLKNGLSWKEKRDEYNRRSKLSDNFRKNLHKPNLPQESQSED